MGLHGRRRSGSSVWEHGLPVVLHRDDDPWWRRRESNPPPERRDASHPVAGSSGYASNAVGHLVAFARVEKLICGDATRGGSRVERMAQSPCRLSRSALLEAAVESKQGPLFLPIEGEVSALCQRFGRHVDGLGSSEHRRDDVGCEERERQETSDVTVGDSLFLRDFNERAGPASHTGSARAAGRSIRRHARPASSGSGVGGASSRDQPTGRARRAAGSWARWGDRPAASRRGGSGPARPGQSGR